MQRQKAPQDLCHRFFDQDSRAPNPDFTPDFTYVICSTPRSGSTLLSHLLAATGQHGVPHEYLNLRTCMPVLAKRFNLVEPGGALPVPDEQWLASYLRALYQRRTSPTGVFGIKMHFDQFAPFRASPSVSALVMQSKCILMVRSDLLGQAASFERAAQTRAWRSGLRERKTPTYSRDAIARRMKEITGQLSRWTAYLREHDIASMQVAYEDLCAHPAETLHAVGTFLGMPVPTDTAGRLASGIPMAIQRDTLSEQWRESFLAEQA